MQNFPHTKEATIRLAIFISFFPLQNNCTPLHYKILGRTKLYNQKGIPIITIDTPFITILVLMDSIPHQIYSSFILSYPAQYCFHILVWYLILIVFDIRRTISRNHDLRSIFMRAAFAYMNMYRFVVISPYKYGICTKFYYCRHPFPSLESSQINGELSKAYCSR